jgi:hypothetical protein
MQAEKTTLTTVVLGAPVDWDGSAECIGLPVVQTQTGYASFWRPSREELAALNAGAFIALHVWGRAHPPVAIEVEQVVTSKIIEAV